MGVLQARRYRVRWPIQMEGMACGHTINVSYSGVLFSTSEQFAVGTLLSTDLHVSPDQSIPIVLQVVRDGGQVYSKYRYGALYHDISEETLQILTETLLDVALTEFRAKHARTLAK